MARKRENILFLFPASFLCCRTANSFPRDIHAENRIRIPTKLFNPNSVIKDQADFVRLSVGFAEGVATTPSAKPTDTGYFGQTQGLSLQR